MDAKESVREERKREMGVKEKRMKAGRVGKTERKGSGKFRKESMGGSSI